MLLLRTEKDLIFQANHLLAEDSHGILSLIYHVIQKDGTILPLIIVLIGTLRFKLDKFIL